MSQGPTVKDLVKMGGGRQRQLPEMLILPMAEMILLHNVIMAAPPKGEGLAVESTDKRLDLLRDHKLIQQDPQSQRWLPTAAGIKHVMPTRKPDRAARRAADALLSKVNGAVVAATKTSDSVH